MDEQRQVRSKWKQKASEDEAPNDCQFIINMNCVGMLIKFYPYACHMII